MDLLTEEHIELIVQRVAKQVSNQDLANDLVDHYCCVIEEQMALGSDFETAYDTAFKAISPNGMQEIQEELFFLLTIKKQISMRRIVLISGLLAAFLYTAGIIFKFMHWPGASVCIVLGIASFCFAFLPTLFLVTVREKKNLKEKLLTGSAMLSGILISLSVVFLVMHWPGALVLGYSAVAVLLLLFMPVNIISGLKNSQTRLNVIATSVFIVTGCGLWLTLVASPRSQTTKNLKDTQNFLRNERILRNEQKYVNAFLFSKQSDPVVGLDKKIYNSFEWLKTTIIEKETGLTALDENIINISPDDKTKLPLILKDKWTDTYFAADPAGNKRIEELKHAIAEYNERNARVSPELQPLPTSLSILDNNGDRSITVLNDCVQVQMIILQNQRTLAAL